jgi:hypothetical protein
VKLLTESEGNGSSPALSNIWGRMVRPANDIPFARELLDECLAHHSECDATRFVVGGSNKIEREPFISTRLINVGPEDGSQESFLDEDAYRHSEYLTLSYRWGDSASILKTTKGTLAEHKKSLPFDSLCQTFQDAVTITR